MPQLCSQPKKAKRVRSSIWASELNITAHTEALYSAKIHSWPAINFLLVFLSLVNNSQIANVFDNFGHECKHLTILYLQSAIHAVT